MGDLDNNQFQQNIHDFANNTVVPSGADREANTDNNNNRLRIMNNREWTDEQKHRIVEIDTHERRRGKNFMKRIKARWDAEFPDSKRTAQNLIDNAKRFRKEGWGNQLEQEEDEAEQVVNEVSENQKQLEWTTEMKINLVGMDNEERSKGRGFMKRVKERRWDQRYPEYSSASWQKLGDNSARFKKEPDVMNLILLRQREEQQDVVIANENVEEPIDSDIEVIEQVIIHDIQVEEDEQMEEILEQDERELETLFIAELENMTHSVMLEMEPRTKLPKVKLDNQTCHSGNKILALYLRDVDTIPEIYNKVYTMRRVIASTW